MRQVPQDAVFPGFHSQFIYSFRSFVWESYLSPLLPSGCFPYGFNHSAQTSLASHWQLHESNRNPRESFTLHPKGENTSVSWDAIWLPSRTLNHLSKRTKVNKPFRVFSWRAWLAIMRAVCVKWQIGAPGAETLRTATNLREMEWGRHHPVM